MFQIPIGWLINRGVSIIPVDTTGKWVNDEDDGLPGQCHFYDILPLVDDPRIPKVPKRVRDLMPDMLAWAEPF